MTLFSISFHLRCSQIAICLKEHVVATCLNRISPFPTPASPLNSLKSIFASPTSPVSLPPLLCLSALSQFDRLHHSKVSVAIRPCLILHTVCKSTCLLASFCYSLSFALRYPLPCCTPLLTYLILLSSSEVLPILHPSQHNLNIPQPSLLLPSLTFRAPLR